MNIQTLRLDIKTSVYKNGSSTLNALFSEAGQGVRFGYDGVNAMKKREMLRIKEQIVQLIKDNQFTKDSLMNPHTHLFLEIHPYDKSSDVDNYGILVKWLTDTLEGIRIQVNEDDTLTFLSYQDSHSKTKFKKDLDGQPFLSNDNFKNILDLHMYYAGRSTREGRRPYVDVLWTNDWDDYEKLLHKMLKLQRHVLEANI